MRPTAKQVNSTLQDKIPGHGRDNYFQFRERFFIPATKNTQIMSDDKNIRGPQDRSRINLQEDYEVRYWTEKFRITKEVLTEAVQEVGSVASRVEDWLRTQGKM
jgi:hypothetical protein